MNINGQSCGTPAELYVKLVGVDNKVCKDCYALHELEKKRSKCRIVFTPGCAAKFLCSGCLASNKTAFELLHV